MGFLGGSDSKEFACNTGDPGLIPGSGRSPGEGKGNSLQYSCLGNPMDRGAWGATVRGVTKNHTKLMNQVREGAWLSELTWWLRILGTCNCVVMST